MEKLCKFVMNDCQSRDHAAFGGRVVCALVKGHPKTCSTFMVKVQNIQINRSWFKKKFEEEIRPMIDLFFLKLAVKDLLFLTLGRRHKSITIPLLI